MIKALKEYWEKLPINKYWIIYDRNQKNSENITTIIFRDTKWTDTYEFSISWFNSNDKFIEDTIQAAIESFSVKLN